MTSVDFPPADFCYLSDVPALATSLVQNPDRYRYFLPLLRQSSNPEEPIPLLASSFLTSVVSASLVSSSRTSQIDEEALRGLYSYLATLTKNPDSGFQDISVQEYSALLRTKRSREVFWEQRNATVDPLMEILRAAAGLGKDNDSTTLGGAGSIRSLEAGGVGLQLLYHILLVIWQLSFEGSLVGDELESYETCEILKRAYDGVVR